MLEGVAVAVVSTAAGEACKAVIGNGRQTSQKHDLERNYRRLIEEAKMLYAMRYDKEAEAKKHEEKKFSAECECWISSVNDFEKEMEKLQAKYNEQKNTGKIKKYLDPRSKLFRSKLRRDITEKWENLESLKLRGKFETFLVEKAPEPIRIMHAPKIEDKSSPYWAIEAILGLLKDANIRRIGLWGMPGIGKSTLMKNLNDNRDISKMFDIVIWVKVPNKGCIEMLQDGFTQGRSIEMLQDKFTQRRCIKMLQDEIIQRLNLNVKDIISPMEIARRISKELECKRYLLLLDEVYDFLNLKEIGIFENHKNSKVVLATRYRRICFDMKTDEQIKLKCLCEVDAYKMFKEEVGQNINIPRVEPIARLVASKCGGLPLLLEKVAKSFRSKDSFELWSDGLRNFQRWPSIKIQGMDELIEFLKFCYEDLDCEDKQFCFLYIALYPEDFEIYIDYLLECWIAEGFIHDTNQLRVAREKGHTILHDLINVSLLERNEKMTHVSLNKVLRDMALKISLKSSNFKALVKTPLEQGQCLSKEEWQQAKRISLTSNGPCILPDMPDCKNLLTLLLLRNQDLQFIPISFFGHMESLRVLDLQGTGITALPSSISCLICLKALYLLSCVNLVEFSFNEKELPSLEVLDIRHTKINYLPIEIGYLTQLKSLRMSLSSFGIGQSRGAKCHQDILSKLSLLEELVVDALPNNLEWEEVLQATIKEVANLAYLGSLSICFPTANCLELFISKSPLWEESYFTFQFSVGYHDTTRCKDFDYFDYQIKRSLKFVNGRSAHPAISKVLAKTDVFELIGYQGALELSNFDVSGLRGCLIERCYEIQTIVDGDTIGKSVLECLEKMYINNVPKLVSIWKGVVHVGSLAQLKTLALQKCPSLTKIFSSGIITELSKLQHLEVVECFEIEEIIKVSENQGLEHDALPSLKELVLVNLPKVNSIWIDGSMNWPSLKRVKISMCPILRRLPFNNENAMNLVCVEVQQSWWDTLEWQEDAAKQRLQSICTFK